jgi:hypothetical protein
VRQIAHQSTISPATCIALPISRSVLAQTRGGGKEDEQRRGGGKEDEHGEAVASKAKASSGEAMARKTNSSEVVARKTNGGEAVDQWISGSVVEGAPTEEPRPDASNARRQRPATRATGVSRDFACVLNTRGFPQVFCTARPGHPSCAGA